MKCWANCFQMLPPLAGTPVPCVFLPASLAERSRGLSQKPGPAQEISNEPK